MKDTVYGLVSNDLEVDTLKALCVPDGIQTGPFGSQLHRRDYLLVGTPIITVEHLGENRILHQDLPRVSDEDKERLSRYVMRKGDIIFSRVGSVDRRALVRDDEDGWLFSGRCLRVRPDNAKIDSGYLSWFFGLETFRDYIRRIAVGATMPSLNTELLSNVPVIVRPLPEQRAIAEVLGALDDKIELNRRMNRTLEAMARTVFQDVMKDEGGRMKVGTVGEDFNLTMGQSPPGETYNEKGEGVPFFQGCADFGFRYPQNRVYCTAPTRFAKAGDTLVSVRAPVGDVNMAWEECAIGRGVAAVRHKTGSRSYTYYAVKYLEEDFGRFEAEGTVFGSINKEDFENLEILIPTTEQVEKLEKFCYPIDQMIENNENESRTLTSVRDTLLPKLMRGEIRVKDAV